MEDTSRMALTILLLVLFTLLLLIYGWRNRYFIFFAVLVFASALSMLTLTVEIAKVSNYLVPANYLIRPLEIRLYRFFHAFAYIPLSTLLVLRNAGIVLYFGGIVCFVQSFSSSIRMDSALASARRLSLRYVPLIGFPVLFFAFYHPQTAYRFFRMYHSAGMRSVEGVIRIADIVMTVCVLLYLVWPVLFLLINYRKGRMTFLSGLLLRVAGTLLILNTSFFLLFFTGVFRMSYRDALQYGFWRFTMPTQIPVFYTSVFPILSFCIMFVVFVTLMRLHADHIFNFFKFRSIRKNLNALYVNVRNIMHSEKNLLFTIRILTQDAMDTQDKAERDTKMQKILDLCSRNMDVLTRTLNDAHDMRVNTVQSNFIEAVETAVSDLHISDSVQIIRNYPEQLPPLFFDKYHMTHAISNILSNSMEALDTAKPAEPTIRLDVYFSRGWMYFSVWDNGCGIPSKLLRKVDRPYVSTKNKKNSWGIGLSYVFSVVRAHSGQMHIRSQQNRYTQVEILLPRAVQRR